MATMRNRLINLCVCKPSKSSTVDIAKGMVLMDYYQKAKQYEAVIEITQKLLEFAPEKGRAVQIYSILGRFTPMGMLKYAQSEINKVIQILAEERGQQWVDDNRT